MRVPNAEAARVEVPKVVDYLLGRTHPVGKGKARFFKGLGFSPDRPRELISALLNVVRNEEVVDQRATPHGRIFIVDGLVEGKEGNAVVRTVWVVETHETSPRLVTAYPASEG